MNRPQVRTGASFDLKPQAQDDKPPGDRQPPQDENEADTGNPPQPSSEDGPAQGIVLTPQQERARSRRNIVLALSLLAFVVLVFVVTVVRLTANITAQGQ